MQTNNRTEIATLGEFGLIKHLTKDIEILNPETQYGIGDDAAVLEMKNQQTLGTKLWHELSKVNLADFDDFLRENSQYVRWIDLENMTYLKYYGAGVWNEADFSKMSLDDITEVFNQLERYCNN